MIVSFFTSIVGIYLGYLQASKNSKQYSLISALKYSLITFLSMGLIILFNTDKYLGRIYAPIIISIIFAVYSFYKLSLLKPLNFDFQKIKYALKLGIPLLPHVLSGFILASFDRLIINQLNGPTDAGIYSFAYNVAIIMSVIVMGMNKSWTPMFLEKIKTNEDKKLEGILSKYALYIYLAAALLILFAKEMSLLMANINYQSGLSIVPIIIISYVFVFIYSIYALYAFAAKKTILISINTLFAGSLNIALNYLLIPKYGYKAAALATLVSYIVLFALHYINAKFVLKLNVFSISKVLKNIYLVFLSYFVFLVTEYYLSNYLLGLRL
jgi:O-antigen/teichoic acid export membrane protein